MLQINSKLTKLFKTIESTVTMPIISTAGSNGYLNFNVVIPEGYRILHVTTNNARISAQSGLQLTVFNGHTDATSGNKEIFIQYYAPSITPQTYTFEVIIYCVKIDLFS